MTTAGASPTSPSSAGGGATRARRRSRSPRMPRGVIDRPDQVLVECLLCFLAFFLLDLLPVCFDPAWIRAAGSSALNAICVLLQGSGGCPPRDVCWPNREDAKRGGALWAGATNIFEACRRRQVKFLTGGGRTLPFRGVIRGR